MTSVGEQLMSLLLEEVPVEDFQRVLDDVERRPCDATEIEDVRQRVGIARKLRTLLDAYKRRGAQLAALYDTASDLSSLRDVEMVLQVIVRRGRQLLGTDVAYLMLIDEERGDTVMRVTEGTVTSDFSKIRLELGIGLGGLVAQTAAPHWTSDYLQDRRYRHAIDDVVTDERLVAILGVPLKVGRRVLGVLFAADRRPRTFVQEDVSLLSSLAAYATVAIENAALFQETRDAVVRLTEAMAVLERHNEALERASAMHQRLTSLVLAGGSDADIARTVVEGLDGTLFVLDPDSRVTARAGHPAAGPWSAIEQVGAVAAVAGGAEIADLLNRASTSRRSVDATLGDIWSRVVPVVTGGDSFGGWLVFVGGELGEADRRALDRTATVAALLHLNQRARDEAENRVRGELLAELLSVPVTDVCAIQRRAVLVGVDLSGAMSAIVALPVATSALARVQAEAAALARASCGLVTTQGTRVVLLLPGDDPGTVATDVASSFGKVSGCRVTVGGAGPVTDLSDTARYARQASRCADVLLLLGRAGQGAAAPELGVYGLLSGAGQEQVQSFVQRALGAVERYDRERGTALLDSVQCYFDHDGNVVHAAQDLIVHANTLYQRLDRLDQLLGAGWRSGERALELRLALGLRRLAQGGSDRLDPSGGHRRPRV